MHHVVKLACRTGAAGLLAVVLSFIAVKWLLRYIQTHTFNVFGWYRIALAIAIFILLLR